MNTEGRILVVEDDPDVLNGTALLLEKAGYAIEKASTGEQALQRIREEPPDLILLDRDLPDFDGNALCRQIKQDEGTAHIQVVIASSTYVESDQQAQGLESGADGYITRPISNREFLARVRSFVSIHHMTRSLREQAAQLQEQNEILQRQRLASLNLMEDAVEGRERVEAANRALRESEERFRRVSAITSDIAYSCSAAQGGPHAIKWMTGAADRITGYTTEEIQARSCWRFLVLEEDRTLFDQQVIGLEAGAMSNCELRIQRKDGSIGWIESTAECSEDPQHPGRLLLYGGLKDITERKRIEQEIVAAKDRAERSEKLKDSFIANISHEIRTPLNIILGYIGVIAEKFLPQAAEGDQRFFESVERGGERLMRTVDMILNVSRLQAGEFTLRPAEVDLSGLVRRIVSDHQSLAQKKKIVLSSVDECGNAVVWADEYCITQAVSNLLNNAIKFTLHGQVEARVFRNHEGKPCISCRDTGIGIAKDYLPLLFSRYTQEQTGYSRPFEGLGLGMSLVKEYLQLNHATIEVESEKGVGTTFTITFHGGALPEVDASTEEERAHPVPDNAAAKRMKAAMALPAVLLVEDDEMTIEFMRVILDGKWTVHSARSGEEAWAVLRSAHVDIILMDISLAGHQTGLELTQEIRQNPAYRIIPIIAVTAHAYASDRDNCLDAGCDDFIRKPIDSALVLGTMDRLLVR
jgi:PAS domain S-box-containing protein